MKGVIMAGGKGTRMRPLTCHLPKPMVPLFDKPLMEYTIEWLKKFGITEIAVTIQYLGERIKQYFGDGSHWGVKIVYFEEESPLGTAGGIKNAASFFDDTFVVISGDVLTDFNLSEAIDFHYQNNAMATILMAHEDEPLDYGGMLVFPDGKIHRFIEKPKWNEVYSDFVNTGIYILEPNILEYVRKNDPCDFGRDLFPLLLASEKKLYGFLANGYWSDIGTIQQYRKAHYDILNKKVKTGIKGEEIFTNVWVGKNVEIEDGAVLIGPLFIGEGTVIRKKARIEPYSVIGAHSQISESASIKQSIIWNDVYIGKNCELRGSIIANGTYVARNVEMLDYAVTGGYCKINKNVRVKPHVKIWPKKTVSEGAVVHASLVWEKNVRKSLFGKCGISGIANIEMTPDFISKVASAYGSTLPFGSKVIVAGDGHPFTKLLMQVFIQSLHATGVATVECPQSATAPMVRYYLSQRLFDGGVFFQVTDTEQEVYLDILDGDGYPIDGVQERKIECVLASEDFRRVPLERIGRSDRDDQLVAGYVEAMQKEIHVHPYKRFKAVIGCATHLRETIQKIAETINCEAIFAKKNQNLLETAEYVRNNHADFAILLNKSGEQFIVIDENGNILTEEQLLSIYIMVTLLLRSHTRVPVPNHASSALDILANKLNGEAIRIKMNRRDMLIALHDTFHFYLDALYAFTQLIQLLSLENCSLSQFIELIPRIHLLRDNVSCPWNARGFVMRKLIEDTIEEKVDLVDGIKVYHSDGGWTLILPELDKPVFTIYSQAADLKKARELATHFIKKIRQYQNV